MRRRISSCDFGPGTGVRNWIVGISVPSDGLFVEIDVNLLRFQIFLDAPGPELTAKARLLVASPGSLYVSGLHVIHPDNAGAERLDDAESLENIARPVSRGEPIGSSVGDANRFGFVGEGNDGSYGAENFFLRDAGGIVHIVENCGFYVVAAGDRGRAAAAGRELGFLFADLLIRTDALVLGFADERAHFRVAIERRAEANGLRLGGHRFHEFRIDGLFHQDAAARRTDFALIDEDAEERAVNGRLEIRVGEKDVGGFAAELERDALDG